MGNYLTSLRITKAKEMLRFSDLQIETIARNCGIEDNSYFNKVFQKAEGLPPGNIAENGGDNDVQLSSASL